MLGLAWYFSRNESLEAYFLNKKKTGLWLMVFSTVSTIVGATATISVVSEVYNSGISYGLALAIAFSIGVFVLGLASRKIKQAGDKYKAYSIADIFEKRFDKKNKNLIGILQLILLIGWIATNIAGISALSTIVLGINYSLAITLSVIITLVYSALGGLKLDIITDFIQFWIILIPFAILALIGYNEIGSISHLILSLPAGHLNIFAFGGIPWFLGTILLSGFIYLGTAYHWQRIFSAKDQNTAQKSFYLSIPFLILIGMIILFFGLLASVLLKDINQDYAIFSLMTLLLPKSLAGLGFAAILAAIMSSVDSSVVAGSTIIYKFLEEKKLIAKKSKMSYARLITAVFGILAGVLVFLIPGIVTLSLFVSYLALTFVPSIFAALYSKSISSNASFYSLLISSILLIVLFPILGKNSFIIPILSAILITLFYDKIFRRPKTKFVNQQQQQRARKP
jgi:SSS family solute:Na+ symporter